MNMLRLNLEHAGGVCAAAPSLRLVELVPKPPAAPAAAEPVRYTVGCGDMSVDVDARFDEATLRRLLRVMASC